MKIVLCKIDEKDNSTVYQEFLFQDGNPEEWRGETVYGELLPDGSLSPTAMVFLGKAHDNAALTNDKVQLILVGETLVETARSYFTDGVDRIFVYDDPKLCIYDPDQYTSVLMHFINNYKPAAVYFEHNQNIHELCDRLIESVKTILPFEEEKIVRESTPKRILSGQKNRGELVICEIPD